jgi:hypothetical protein
VDEELCACFIVWQKAFDLINWTKLGEIPKGTGIKLAIKITNNTWVRVGETRSLEVRR